MAKNTTPKRPKRKNGEGTFSKNGNGFDYRFPYKDVLGNTKYGYVYGKTKEICLAKAEKRKAEELGICSDDDVSGNMLISQWANYWFDNYVVSHVKVTTINDDRSILDKHIIPDLGHRPLNSLTGIRLTKFYNEC